jgi:hypothetical protein
MSTYEFVPHAKNFGHEIAEYYCDRAELTDPVLRRDYFEHLSPEDYIDFIQEANALIRTGSADQSQIFDGQDVTIAEKLPPDHRDKEQLLKETWTTAQEFLKDQSLSDEDALTYAGLVSAAGIIMVHPYADSNGRTGRVTSYLMVKGPNGSADSDLEAIVTNEDDHTRQSGTTGQAAWFAHPSPIIRRHANYYPFPFTYDSAIDQAKRTSLPPMEKTSEPVARVLENQQVQRIFATVMEHTDKEARQIIAPAFQTDERGETSIGLAQAMEALVHDGDKGITYAAHLNEVERAYRSQFVRNFLTAVRDLRANKPATDINDKIERRAKRRAKQVEISEGEDNDDVRRGDEKHAALVEAAGKYVINGKISTADYLKLDHEVSSQIVRRGSSHR